MRRGPHFLFLIQASEQVLPVPHAQQLLMQLDTQHRGVAKGRIVVWRHASSRMRSWFSVTAQRAGSSCVGCRPARGPCPLAQVNGTGISCTFSDQSPSPIARIACFCENLKPSLRIIVEL